MYISNYDIEMCMYERKKFADSGQNSQTVYPKLKAFQCGLNIIIISLFLPHSKNTVWFFYIFLLSFSSMFDIDNELCIMKKVDKIPGYPQN